MRSVEVVHIFVSVCVLVGGLCGQTQTGAPPIQQPSVKNVSVPTSSIDDFCAGFACRMAPKGHTSSFRSSDKQRSSATSVSVSPRYDRYHVMCKICSRWLSMCNLSRTQEGASSFNVSSCVRITPSTLFPLDHAVCPCSPSVSCLPHTPHTPSFRTPTHPRLSGLA